jgi:hypothetical protein
LSARFKAQEVPQRKTQCTKNPCLNRLPARCHGAEASAPLKVRSALRLIGTVHETKPHEIWVGGLFIKIPWQQTECKVIVWDCCGLGTPIQATTGFIHESVKPSTINGQNCS